MTSHLARALYDFIGEEEGDLTISAGDVLTVHDHDVGTGWVQATAQDGSQVCVSLTVKRLAECCAGNHPGGLH